MPCDPTTQTIWCGNELTRVPAQLREPEWHGLSDVDLLSLPWDVIGVIGVFLLLWTVITVMTVIALRPSNQQKGR